MQRDHTGHTHRTYYALVREHEQDADQEQGSHGRPCEVPLLLPGLFLAVPQCEALRVSCVIRSSMNIVDWCLNQGLFLSINLCFLWIESKAICGSFKTTLDINARLNKCLETQGKHTF